MVRRGASTKVKGKRMRGPDQKPRRRNPNSNTLKGAGPGRKKGQTAALPLGTVAAIRGLRHRVPEDASETAAEVADLAFETIVKVMQGKIQKGTRDRLGAARIVREEVCGPIPKTIEVRGEIDLYTAIRKAEDRVDDDGDGKS